MQISRHWRINAQRYRLAGYRYTDGTVSLQQRPVSQPDALHISEYDQDEEEAPGAEAVPVMVGSRLAS